MVTGRTECPDLYETEPQKKKKNENKRYEKNLYHNVTTIEVYTYRLTFPRPIKFHPFLTSQAEGRGVFCLHIIKSSRKGRRIF